MAEVFRAPLVQVVPRGKGPAPMAVQAGAQTNVLLTMLAGQDALPIRPIEWRIPIGRGPSHPWTPPSILLTVLVPTGPVTMPFLPGDFPLPRQKPRTVQTLSYRPASAAPTARVPFPFSSVFDVPLRDPRFSIALRTYLKPYDAYVVPTDVGAAPVNMTDWPLPLSKPVPGGFRSFVSGPDPKFVGIDALPSRLSDWSLPVGKAFPLELRTYLDPLNPVLVNQDKFFGAPGQPPSYQSMAVPQGTPLAVALRTWAPGGILPTLNGVVSAPIIPYESPLPILRAFPVSLRTHLSFYVLDDSAPFAQTSWPLPAAVPALRSLRTFTDPVRTLLTGADTLPFALRDWPNPRPKAFPPDLRTFTKNAAVYLIGKDALPFDQTDWRLPLGKPYPLELRTWLQTLDAGFVERPPISLTAWPNPQAKAFPLALRTWTQTRNSLLLDTLFGSAGRPLSNYDWPLPQGKPFPPALRTWLQGLSGPNLLPIFYAFWAIHSNKYIGRQGEGTPE